MPFDLLKVEWTDEELNAAVGFDKIFEGLADGLDIEDILLVIEAQPLWSFLKSATKKEYADKILALAMLMYRDNA
jgi:hypothetical protein